PAHARRLRDELGEEDMPEAHEELEGNPDDGRAEVGIDRRPHADLFLGQRPGEDQEDRQREEHHRHLQRGGNGEDHLDPLQGGAALGAWRGGRLEARRRIGRGLDGRLTHGFAPLPPSKRTDFRNASKAGFCFSTRLAGPPNLKNHVWPPCGIIAARMRCRSAPPCSGPVRSTVWPAMPAPVVGRQSFFLSSSPTSSLTLLPRQRLTFSRRPPAGPPRGEIVNCAAFSPSRTSKVAILNGTFLSDFSQPFG